MAFTILTMDIADANATELPTSKVHHAQRSPKRNEVTAMALPINPNSTQ
jgi:hypothetical protein